MNKILIGLIVLIFGATAILFYLNYKNQEEAHYISILNETRNLLGTALKESTYETYINFDSISKLDVVNNTVYYYVFMDFKDVNGNCPLCYLFSFSLASPRHCCIIMNETQKYCPEQNVNFSEMLYKTFKNATLKELQTIEWIAPTFDQPDHNGWLKPVTLNGKGGLVADYEITWEPTEDEILRLGGKDPTRLTQIKKFTQTTNATIIFPNANASIPNCLTFYVVWAINHTISVKVPNRIMNYSTNCTIEDIILKTDTELKMRASCYSGYENFTICYQ